jgi:UDP:flavonoid glycosyltransferase YjiC (YdhE family)
VALGMKLRQRGHRMMMIASAYFADLARRARFEFAASLSTEDYLSLIDNPDTWHPLRLDALVDRGFTSRRMKGAR